MFPMRRLVRHTTNVRARLMSSSNGDDLMSAKDKYVRDMRRVESGYMKKLMALSIVGLLAGYYYIVHVVDYPEEFCDEEE